MFTTGVSQVKVHLGVDSFIYSSCLCDKAWLNATLEVGQWPLFGQPQTYEEKQKQQNNCEKAKLEEMQRKIKIAPHFL